MSAAPIPRRQDDPKAEFGSIFENSPLGSALCDCRGNIVAVNSAWERLLGVGFEDKGTLSLAGLIQSGDQARTERMVLEVLNGKSSDFQVDTFDHAGGPLRLSVWRIQESRILQGKYNGAAVIAVVEGLSGALPAQQRIRQADRLEAVGRLAGGVAHDFNNVLTGVLLYCDLLLATIIPGRPERKYAEEIRKAGLQATGLVRQLLALTRPPEPQARLLSLNEIAEGMRDLLVRLIGENIELRLVLDPNLGLVRMDPTQAQQVLLNLVLNARDAMPLGGRITVVTRVCKLEALANGSLAFGHSARIPCAFFAVEDNGKGMDGETRAHVLEPFFTTKAGKGTGLGLATVHEIVTTNGGLIHVQSTPDQGTRISVILPLVPQAIQEAPDTNNFCPIRREKELSSIEEE